MSPEASPEPSGDDAGPTGARARTAARTTARTTARSARDRPDPADRVRRSHAQTRTTIRFALAFFAAAALAAVWDHGRWLPLHLFLAGGVVLAISGVSLMLTVTWSAAPAPPDRWVTIQRTLIIVGAAGVGIGRTADVPAVVAVTGTAFLLGLLALAGLLAWTIRRGPKRRFDAAVAAYLAAVAAGVVGVGLGVTMALDSPTLPLRSAHATANLLGLVGLTIGGTLPFFAATVGRSKMARHTTPRRLAVTLAWQVAMVAAAVISLALDVATVPSVTLVGYAVGILVILAWMPRPTRRQWTWAGPRLVALWLGGFWWCAAVVATAVDAATGTAVLDGRWLVVMVLAGYGQIAWGSLAYLLPMLRGGGPDQLSDGFATTRSWPGLVAINVAGVAVAVAVTPVAVAAVAVWLLDAAVRAARVGTRRAERQATEPSSTGPSTTETSTIRPSTEE